MVKYYWDTETYKYNPNKKVYEPVLDTRSYVLGGIMNEEGKIDTYQNKEELKNKIYNIAENNKKNKKTTELWSHNANYEFYTVFLKEIQKGEWTIIRQDPLLAINKEKKIYIKDTMALVDKSLKEIGEIIGIPKLEMPPSIKEIQELEKYMTRDIEITRQLLKKITEIITEIKGEKPRSIWTTPQLAKNNFINWIIKNKKGYGIIEIKGQKLTRIIPTKYDKLLRKAYRLGRNEAFKTGKYKKATLIDQNRQFPYSATQMNCPNLLTETYINKENITKIDTNKAIQQYEGIINCKIKTNPKDWLGILPIKTKKYMFITPKGEHIINGTWTLIEIRKALEEGYEIQTINWMIIYKRLRNNPLKEYFEEMYKIEEQDPNKKFVIKLLMNSLTGKFGSKHERKTTKIIPRKELAKKVHEGWKLKGEIDNKVLIEKETEEETQHTNPMLALQITAYSRVQMYEHLKKIEQKDLLYSDTDSIILTNWKKYKEQFKIGNKMGEFKIVKDKNGHEIINQKCEIIKEKAYKIGEIIKLSGLTKSQATKENWNKIRTGEIKQKKMIKFNEAIASGKIDKIGEFEEETFQITEQNKANTELEYEITEEE